MTLINSELPLTMLEHNIRLNEYDFVLFHLYKDHPEYREYYQRMRQDHPERLMIFDNSAYEFFIKNETLDMREFVEAINELQPDMYIVPDRLMDFNGTRDMVTRFMEKYAEGIKKATSGRSAPMAVCQGNSSDELFNMLLMFRDMDIRNVAIPFHNSFFTDYIDDHIANNWRLDLGAIKPDHRYALGRINFVNKAELLLRTFKHVHLLGSHCPFEKRYYDQSLIKTMDTGYPVKAAIAGYRLGCEPAKPDIIIDDFMTTPLTPKQQTLIDLNINCFKAL